MLYALKGAGYDHIRNVMLNICTTQTPQRRKAPTLSLNARSMPLLLRLVAVQVSHIALDQIEATA